MLNVCRLAARAAVPKQLVRATPRAVPALRSFHAGVPSREEKKETAVADSGKVILTPTYIVDQLGLDDWKRALPIGLFLAIPALSQEWIVLTEETQLLGCFMLFVGTVYAKFGDTIGASLDAQADAILEARNKDEDAQLEIALEGIEFHKARLAAADITKDLIALQKEHMENTALLQTKMAPHAARDTVIQLLDNMVASQANDWNSAHADLVNKAVSSVQGQVTSDKKLKKTALDEALIALADPTKATQGDAVTGLFVKFFQDTAAAAQKDSSAERTVTAAERQALIESIDAQTARFAHVDGIEEQAKRAKSLIPTKYKGSLAKEFLKAQASAQNQ